MSYRVDGPRWLHNGDEFQFLGVNTTGFEGPDGILFGLWTGLSMKEYVAQLKAMGHNGVRIPYAPKLFSKDPYDPGSAGIWQGSNGEYMRGWDRLQILDEYIKCLEDAQIRYVFSSHYTEEWQAGKKTEIPSLWYTRKYSERQWLDEMLVLAIRYKGRPGFAGIDVKNEPKDEANKLIPGDRAATWGTGDKATDWKMASERAYKEIHAVNPDLLYFVEITGKREGLAAIINNPPAIPSDQYVPSYHEYGLDVWQDWGEGFKDPSFPRNMDVIYDKHFGQFAGNHPLFLGEIGTHYGKSAVYPNQPNRKDIAWADHIFDYMKKKGIKHVTWWALGEEVSGYECGGLYVDGNWRAVREDKLKLLHKLIDPNLYYKPWPKDGVIVRPPVPRPDPEPEYEPTPEPETDEYFKKGDIVQFITGEGPKMVIQTVLQDSVQVVYFPPLTVVEVPKDLLVRV